VKTILCVLTVTFLSLVLCSTFVLGQDVWQLPLTGSSVSLEYLSPSLKELNIVGYNPNISVYSVIATGNFQLHNGNRIIMEVPYVHYHMDGGSVAIGSLSTFSIPEYNTGNIGNIYLAYEIIRDEHFSTTLGIYLPTASDDEAAPEAGTVSDYDQFALYIPNLLSFRPQFNYHSESENLFVNIKTSPMLTYYTKSTSGMHTVDVFFALSLQTGFFIGDFTAGIGWSGNYAATIEAGSFSDRFIDQAGAMAGYKIGPLKPEIFLRFPLSENISDELKSVLGVSVSYEF
jgi:hypothetical protein